MSGALQTWYSPAELDAFADRGAVLRENVELSRLTRLREALGSEAGSVEAVLEFAPRRTGWMPAELKFETRLELTCQRCLEPFELAVQERIELGFVDSPAMEACLPEGRVAVVLEDERVSPVELLEDELIVSLPLVPRHANTAECGGLARHEARDDVNAGASSSTDH